MYLSRRSLTRPASLRHAFSGYSTDTLNIQTSVAFTGHIIEAPSRSVETSPNELMQFYREMALMRRMEDNHYGMETAGWKAAKSLAYHKRGDYVPEFKGDGMNVFAVKQACSFAKEQALKNGPIERSELSSLQFYGNRFFPQLNKKVGASVPQCASSLICFRQRTVSTISENASDPAIEPAPRIKFKRLDKTARNIMQILDREAVAEVKSQREVPDIKPGYIIQMKVVSPENKRRVTTIKGIVIARRNAGLNSTFRVRRLVAGVGVESLFPLYSPNIKEVKVLDKKKVRRAKLYYLRDKMNPLKK